MRFADEDLIPRGERFKSVRLRLEAFLSHRGFSVGEARQRVCSSICFALTKVDSKVIPGKRELLGPPDLARAQTLCSHEPTKVVVVGKDKYLAF